MAKQTDLVKDRGTDRPAPAGAANTGTKTDDLRDENVALEDQKLITSIDDRLKNLGDMMRPEKSRRANPAVEEDDEDQPDGEEIAEDAEAPADDAPADKPADADSSTLDEDKGLPEAYVRCAVAYGWKEQDVVDLYKNDPERALTVLSNIYNTRNKVSAEFAAIGRRAQEQHEDTSRADEGFKPIDTAKLREKYGEDAGPLIEMIDAQNKAMTELSARMPKPQPQRVDRVESAVERSGVEQQIVDFFQSDRMKPWQKVYGSLELGQTLEDLPPGAQKHRIDVLTLADRIAGGAHLQRVNMSLADALESAHQLVTAKYREQVIFDGIKEKVVARSKGISTKPSKGTRKLGASEDAKPGSRTKDQLLNDTEKKLNKLFGG
jgi:hypothetical protein